MTTKFLDDNILHIQNDIVGTFPQETAVLDDFPLCPSCPPPQKCKFYFYSPLAVSEI